jgi:hypothetical protein
LASLPQFIHWLHGAEKASSGSPSQAFPAFYATRTFIATFTWTYPEPDESSLHPPTLLP